MEHSQVYRSIHYLIEVRNATPTDRKRLLQNITTDQVLAMREEAKRLTNGHINPIGRDARLFQSRRLMLRTLASPRVGVRKEEGVDSSVPFSNTIYAEKCLSDTDYRG